MRNTLVIIIILLAGVVVTFFTARIAAQAERESLAERSATIAASLPPSALDGLLGSSADLSHVGYLELKETLSRIKEANEDIYFVYILGTRNEGVVFFVADSEDPTSEDYSAPGDIYPEATDELKESFRTAQAFVEGPVSDRWGTWISGLAPMLRTDGSVAGIVGIDIDAHEYRTTVLVASAIPALITLIAIILVLAWYRDARKRDELVRLKFRFLSVASHELRSPIAGIGWALDSLLKKSASLDETTRTMLTRIRGAVTHVSHTVTDVLDASRFDAGIENRVQREAFDLAALIHNVAESFSLNAEERSIALSFEPSFPEHLPISADREKIRRVFANIIANALKYSHSGGTVTLAYEPRDTGGVIMVRDAGIGIPAEEQKHIFSTYYRASNALHHAAHGTGMGLFFTKQLVELHGGDIWFESHEGQGTTFFVKLPMR